VVRGLLRNLHQLHDLGNSAASGGGLYCGVDSFPTLTNCIVWGNTGGSSLAQVDDYRSSCQGSGGLDHATGLMFGTDGNLYICIGLRQGTAFRREHRSVLGEFASGSVSLIQAVLPTVLTAMCTSATQSSAAPSAA